MSDVVGGGAQLLDAEGLRGKELGSVRVGRFDAMIGIHPDATTGHTWDFVIGHLYGTGPKDMHYHFLAQGPLVGG